jgi:hypothetical protein
MALADLLIALRDQVPLTEAQIARGTGADEGTVREWVERRPVPAGEPSQHRRADRVRPGDGDQRERQGPR